MSQTLFYTSMQSGLRPMTSGFCTVACTAGMSMAVIDRLEALSGYGLHDLGVRSGGDVQSSGMHAPAAEAAAPPVVYSFRRVLFGALPLAVLSRIAPAGLDVTRRPNHLAQHVLLDASERPTAGAAWLIAQGDLFANAFDGLPRLLPASPALPATTLEDECANPCATWHSLTGDAGWAGVWVEQWLAKPTKPLTLIYPFGADISCLLREATALLPVERRWHATFTTIHTQATTAGGAECVWRCLPDGLPAANEARAMARDATALLDLTRLPDSVPAGAAAEAARAGQIVRTNVPRHSRFFAGSVGRR